MIKQRSRPARKTTEFKREYKRLIALVASLNSRRTFSTIGQQWCACRNMKTFVNFPTLVIHIVWNFLGQVILSQETNCKLIKDPCFVQSITQSIDVWENWLLAISYVCTFYKTQFLTEGRFIVNIQIHQNKIHCFHWF